LKYLLSLVFVIGWMRLCFAVIPLSVDPSWTSNDNDYATGGALYDITGDGWVDYCTGNGNDMASNTNALYINQSGSLESIASWRSAEFGYYSHIYIGDVDNDGNTDMAVSYLGAGSSEQGPTSIYRNSGSGLDSSAWWFSGDVYNSFDCAFGDVDLDGDLDLAAIAGDAYSGLHSPARIYRNNGGVVEMLPYWTAADSSPGDACRWADIDDDGYLDLVVGYRHKFAIFHNNGGILEQYASWSATVLGWVLRIAIGDYDNDGFKDVAIACNGQLGGDESSIEVFHNDSGTVETVPAYRMLTATNYCSCVEWGDANDDGYLDLAAGGWWESPVVFENGGGNLDTIPAWVGNVLPVCESVFWGDVRNHALDSISDLKSGDGIRKLFYFEHHPIHSFQGILVGGMPVPLSDYCYDPLTGWISLKDTPPAGSDNIEIRYAYSHFPDLGVTNWDPGNGSYLFRNTAAISEPIVIHPDTRPVSLLIYPNPFFDKITIRLDGISDNQNIRSSEINIYDISGRVVKRIPLATGNSYLAHEVSWNGRDKTGSRAPTGIYIVEVRTPDILTRQKITKLN
jgi:hypothetical protein